MGSFSCTKIASEIKKSQLTIDSHSPILQRRKLGKDKLPEVTELGSGGSYIPAQAMQGCQSQHT